MVRLALILILCFIFHSLPVMGKDIISWQTYHRPPGIIKTGPENGQGFVQKSLALITDQLTEYEHKMPLATIARALSDIKEGKFVCHPALYKTKTREEFISFSNASMVSPSNRLVAKKGLLDKFVRNNAVDLSEVLKDGQFSFALLKSRSYTESIDKQLQPYINEKNIYSLVNTDLAAIFKMINIHRADLTILYPFELEYFVKHNPASPIELTTYKIKGVEPYNMGYIACPKNEWGNKVITKVNTILEKIKNTDVYKNAVTTWWESEGATLEFEQFYQDLFLTH